MHRLLSFLLAGAALLTGRTASALPADLTAANFYVPALPDLRQDPDHPLHLYAGHIPSDPDEDREVQSHLYFFLVKNRRTADKNRILFWFNGGPGCSSFDGLMMENGPWRTDGNGGLKLVDGGWEEYTTMVYIDQPAGTGYSYTTEGHYIHTLEEASEQLLVFLKNFYEIFPEYKAIETYLAGESYAGQYIPFFADAILHSDLNIPLRGVALGNGWISARHQYPAYFKFLVAQGILIEGTEAYDKGKERSEACAKLYEDDYQKDNASEPTSVGGCERMLSEIAEVRRKKVHGQEMCMNVYDVRLDDTYPDCGMNWPPEVKPIGTYLNRPEVVSALHASAHTTPWAECSSTVGRQFYSKQHNSSVNLLPGLLERIEVLLFAGDQDYICNYVGQEDTIEALEWGGARGLGDAERLDYTVDNEPAGVWTSARNLTYVKIYNASHMVPYDVPHVAHDMILRFMHVNFSALADGAARIPSSVGTDAKPHFITLGEADGEGEGKPGKTEEQHTAMEEAYFNAGSAIFVLVIVAGIIGAVMWFRWRRQSHVQPSVHPDEEESIPLTTRERDVDAEEPITSNKGKGRAGIPPPAPIFNDEEFYQDR
ncbi:Alpha/Beta hydrolase protein [Schizophyllum commune]